MLQAIETTYRGFRFRSRIEARWAVFFDTLGVSFTYEPEGYMLPGVGAYLPDFWLASLGCWIEIKGTFADGRPVLIFHGQIDPGMLGGFAHPEGQFYARAYVWAQCDGCKRVDIVDIEAYRKIHCPTCATWRLYRRSSPTLRSAYEAARAARFEFSR